MRFVRRRKRKIINFFVSLFKTLLFSLYIAPFLSCLFYLFVSRKIPENPQKRIGHGLSFTCLTGQFCS
jgi:hypothetical protein